MIGYGLEEIYCYVTKKDSLEGAHSSIVDALAQSIVVSHEYFEPFWDKPVGIISLESVWETKRKKIIEQDAELKRQLPVGWSEMDPGWKLPRSMSYSGPEGGPPHGPLSRMVTICNECSLSALFLHYSLKICYEQLQMKPTVTEIRIGFDLFSVLTKMKLTAMMTEKTKRQRRLVKEQGKYLVQRKMMVQDIVSSKLQAGLM